MTIRLANADDLDTVVAITDAAYGHYVPRLGRKPQPMTTDYAPMIAAGQVWLIDAETSGAVHDGLIDGKTSGAGLIILIDGSDHLLIYSVALRPEQQGRGLGRRLLAFAEEKTREAGYNVVKLYTNSLMTENIARYTHLGYLETRRERLNETSSIVYMEKHL